MATKITEFNRTNVRQVLDEVEKALQPIAEKHGLTLGPKGRSFHKTELPVLFQFLIAESATDGGTRSAKEIEWRKYAPSFGLDADDFGREFQHNGKTWRIIGILPKSHKFPILAEDVRSGKLYKLALEAVKFKPESTDKPAVKIGMTVGKRPVAEILADLQRVENGLSPENLTCDGELPRTKWMARQRLLMAERKVLVKELGREPTETEVAVWS